jgi:cell division protein FtsB
MDDLVKRLREKAQQREAIMAGFQGLPIIVTESDTHSGKSAMWMDGGMVGCAQVALSVGEFPCEYLKVIAGLANIAAVVQITEAADALQSLAAENARLTAMIHQLGENAATAAREYAEGMEGMREFVSEAVVLLDNANSPTDDLRYDYVERAVAHLLKGAAAHD